MVPSAVLQVQAIMQRKQEEDRQMRQLVQTLQVALEREKLEVHSLREQVCGRRLTMSIVQLCAAFAGHIFSI